MRATNWVGDAVMSLPALRALRTGFPRARITILAKPWVADLYRRESFADEVIVYPVPGGFHGLRDKWHLTRDLRRRQFDAAILLQNAFEAALVAWLARIPTRIGYNRDGRGFLLTRAIKTPDKSEIPRHERFYYLELLRRAGIMEEIADDVVRLEASSAAEAGRARFRALGWPPGVVGVSPGAAYGSAKRWLPERFAQAAARVAMERGFAVAIFGSRDERPLCEQVQTMLADLAPDVPAWNFAGETTLAQFIELTAACEIFLTNDSGAMHIASALGVPTVAIFGATDDIGTGPAGSLSRVVREPVECSPCLLRECPIDHRCMTRVTAERVARTAFELLK